MSWLRQGWFRKVANCHLQTTRQPNTRFSSSHGTSTKKDHCWAHRMHLNRFKRTDSIKYRIKQEMRKRKILGEFQHLWRLTHGSKTLRDGKIILHSRKGKKNNQLRSWDVTKAALRGKLLALNAYIRRGETSKLRERWAGGARGKNILGDFVIGGDKTWFWQSHKMYNIE